MDSWPEASVELSALNEQLNSGAVSGEPFEQGACASPLPRAYQWADGSAYVNHQDKSTGSLEVGKLADLVVLEHNLFEIPAVEISDTRVVMTFVGGKLVYGNPAAK